MKGFLGSIGKRILRTAMKNKKTFKLKEGINKCSNEEYHGDKSYLSSSSLKTILKDPSEFYRSHILKEERVINPKTQNAFDEGSYAHTLILEPEMIDEEYAFFPGWRKVGKEWEEFKKEHEGKTILSKPQKSRVEKWANAYKKRSSQIDLISGGFPEHTVAGNFLGVPLKVRADYINIDKGYLADIKTTSYSTDVDTFKYTVEQFYYQLSAALYCQIFKQYYDKEFDFYFIVLGKKDCSCEVYKMSEETMNKGNQMVRQAIAKYKECLKYDNWEEGGRSEDKEDFSEDYEILEI